MPETGMMVTFSKCSKWLYKGCLKKSLKTPTLNGNAMVAPTFLLDVHFFHFHNDIFILRVGCIPEFGGRLENTDLPHLQKEPLIICGSSHLGKIIILQNHLIYHHASQSALMGIISSKHNLPMLAE